MTARILGITLRGLPARVAAAIWTYPGEDQRNERTPSVVGRSVPTGPQHSGTERPGERRNRPILPDASRTAAQGLETQDRSDEPIIIIVFATPRVKLEACESEKGPVFGKRR